MIKKEKIFLRCGKFFYIVYLKFNEAQNSLEYRLAHLIFYFILVFDIKKNCDYEKKKINAKKLNYIWEKKWKKN